MSKKTNKPDEVTEAVVEETAAAEAPAEETTAAETTEAAETAAEETAAEETAPEADTTEADEEPAEQTVEEEVCVTGPCGKRFRFVSTIVKKIKEKTAKPETELPAECETDADLDEIILDDDIIAELQEYERREKMKKKVALCAAGALAAGILIGIAIKSKKNKKD